ncbi:hypothetical protein [Protofrankia sp. BMG5.30]|uniref:hypothetical protein n=1 Tax=Protofrankia sp. BMG5.30 TaxID=1834514 RepID=UPI00352A3D9C
MYELCFVLAVTVIATFAGATGFREIGSHAPCSPSFGGILAPWPSAPCLVTALVRATGVETQ